MLNSFVTNKASLYPLAAMMGDGTQHLENFWTAEFCFTGCENLNFMPVSTQNRWAVHCQLPDTAELQWGALKGKKNLLTPPLIWAWHSLSLLGYTGCHCNAKVWQANPASLCLAAESFAPALQKLSWHVRFHLEKSILHGSLCNLHVLCLLLTAFHV